MTFVLASCIVFSFLPFDVEDLGLQRLDGTKWGPIPRELSLQQSRAAPLCVDLDRALLSTAFGYAMDSRADLTRRARFALGVNASRQTVLELRLLNVSIFRSFAGRKQKS
jgi:hypothetical protein